MTGSSSYYRPWLVAIVTLSDTVVAELVSLVSSVMACADTESAVIWLIL
jgi:hypothetical protein